MDNQKILIIEDDPDIRDIIRFYLTEEGFEVIESPDARQVVELVRKHKPCLITLDIKLPGIDGPAAIGLIKKVPEIASIPILVISVIAKDPKVQKLTAQGFIAKPFEKDELITAVKKILANPSSQKARPQKILIVDDEPDVVDIISGQLEQRGFIPLKAFNGKEAIEKATKEKPDLIVLDIRMPKIDGFQLINILHKDKEVWSIPIIVLSGANISEEQKQQNKELGVKKFLTKPFEPEKLIAEIRGALCEKKKS